MLSSVPLQSFTAANFTKTPVLKAQNFLNQLESKNQHVPTAHSNSPSANNKPFEKNSDSLNWKWKRKRCVKPASKDCCLRPTTRLAISDSASTSADIRRPRCARVDCSIWHLVMARAMRLEYAGLPLRTGVVGVFAAANLALAGLRQTERSGQQSVLARRLLVEFRFIGFSYLSQNSQPRHSFSCRTCPAKPI